MPAPRSRVPCLATMRCLPRQWGGEWSPHARALAWADFLARAWAPCLGGERALLASPAWAVCRATACCMPHASLACILAHAVRLQKIPYPLPFPAQSCWLPAMAPRSGSLAVRDGAPQDRAGSARWLRALARMLRAMVALWLRAMALLLRAMVPRAGSHAASDGCARWLACCARWLRALPRMLRAMVARAGSHAARDGAARWLAFCARWCRALGRWCLSMVPHAGALAPRDCAARWFRAQARMCCALVPRAGALAARFRWSFLARREVSCAGNGLPVPTCRFG